VGTSPSKLFSELITALSLVLDLERYQQLYHGRRVAVIATKLAERIMPDKQDQVFYAGLLHDIGSIGLETHVVDHLTLEEQLSNPYVRAHPQIGFQIVNTIPGLQEAAKLILDHHEWWDGRGYPLGKRKEEILLGAQLLRIADNFDVNLRKSPRPSRRDVYQRLRRLSDVEFSENILSLFFRVFRNEEIYKKVVDDASLSTVFYEMEKNVSDVALPYLSDALGTTLKIFAQVIDAKHGYTAGHSERVSRYCVQLAEAMNLSHDSVTKIRFAAYLHDAGKVAIPRATLDKSATLNQGEWSLVKRHPVLTMKILNTVTELRELSQIAGHHHERYDGTGYPDGLKGEEIPFLARIMAVADAFDAMTSLRSYQKTKTVMNALKALRDNAGTQFDPKVVEVACSIWGEKAKRKAGKVLLATKA
jgi:HD-GYP domain-containing protein (c-di-GMP phosphodiesterase class II)